MEVTDALIDKLALLSRLKFNEEERKEIRNDLQRMISFVDKLNELNTTGIKPLIHMSDEINVLSEDEVKGQINREEAFKNAPAHDGKFFKVPKVIRRGQ